MYNLTDDAGNVDHRSSLYRVLLHGTGEDLVHVECALEVDVDDLVKVLLTHLEEVGVVGDACTVDDHIGWAAEPVIHLGQEISF